MTSGSALSLKSPFSIRSFLGFSFGMCRVFVSKSMPLKQTIHNRKSSESFIFCCVVKDCGGIFNGDSFAFFVVGSGDMKTKPCINLCCESSENCGNYSLSIAITTTRTTALTRTAQVFIHAPEHMYDMTENSLANNKYPNA